MNSRIGYVIYFVRKHGWRYVLAGVVCTCVLWLLFNLPRIISSSGYLMGKVGGSDEIATSDASDSESTSVLVSTPVVYIVSDDTLVTNFGIYKVGDTINGFTLQSFSRSSCYAVFAHDGSSYAVSFGVLPVAAKSESK